MILVDTSVWIDHLRKGVAELEALLNRYRVLVHPFVIAEMACGNLRNREEILALLGGLPPAWEASNDEVLFFIGRHRLMGKGIGYVDAHLLASAALTDTAVIWTRDRRLRAVAADLGLAFDS